MNIPTMSQRDSRWASEKLGNSKTLTIGTDGCALVCLTMLLNYVGYAETPPTVNANLKKTKAFQGALIYWPNVQKAYPKIKFVWRGGKYENARVASQIYLKNMPVLVQVDFDGTDKKDFRHWVLFKGFMKANDPWTGKEISTNFYKPLLGYSLFSRV